MVKSPTSLSATEVIVSWNFRYSNYRYYGKVSNQPVLLQELVSWNFRYSNYRYYGKVSNQPVSYRSWCLGISDIATIGIMVKSQTSLSATEVSVLEFQT